MDVARVNRILLPSFFFLLFFGILLVLLFYCFYLLLCFFAPEFSFVSFNFSSKCSYVFVGAVWLA